MRDRWEGGLRIVQICVTSFINAPLGMTRFDVKSRKVKNMEKSNLFTHPSDTLQTEIVETTLVVSRFRFVRVRSRISQLCVIDAMSGKRKSFPISDLRSL